MVGMIKAQTVSTESPVKRLMTPQGVLTVLGLLTGIAVIFLRVAAVDIIIESPGGGAAPGLDCATFAVTFPPVAGRRPPAGTAAVPATGK